MNTLAELKAKFRTVWPLLDERTRRLTAANEAKALGHGGVSLVHRACGLSRQAIHKGMREIEAGVSWGGRIRRPGAGRKPIDVTDPGLVDRLEAMIDAQTRGDPESPLRWTCQSTRAIAATLTRRQHPISHTKVAPILHELDYSLQGKRKTEEGEDHPHRDAQFRYINRGGEALSGQRRAGDLGSYEKERTGRELLQRRPAMATLETAAERAGARFSPARGAAGVSLWHLRYRAQPGICECWDRP